MDLPCSVKFAQYHEIPKILCALGAAGYVIFEHRIFLTWMYAIVGFLFIECVCSLKVIGAARELMSKSKAISEIRFSHTNSNLYDGGQSALLNQEFAVIFKQTMLQLFVMKMIVSVLYITGSFVYDHKEDPFMPLLPDESETEAPTEWKHYRKA